MNGEINHEWYCSADLWDASINYHPNCVGEITTEGLDTCKTCICKHRKHPTPEQFKEEYGEEYPDDGAVYLYNDYEAFVRGSAIFWELMTLSKARQSKRVCVCACTPWGKPPDKWRP